MTVLLLSWLAACNREGGPQQPPGTVPPDPQVCAERPGASLCDGQTAVRCDDAGGIADFQACDPTSEQCIDGSCDTCAPAFQVPHAHPDRVADGGIVVEVDVAGPSIERPARLRPLVIEAAADLSVDGPLVVLDADGAPVTGPVGPGTVLIGATEPGAATITLASTSSGCSAAPRQIDVVAVAPHPIAVSALAGFPWADNADVFTARDPVSARVDLTVYTDREGLEADVYIVPHRPDRRGPILDAVVGPVPIDALDGLTTTVWEQPSTDLVLDPYDLVVDFGRDGDVDPGDLVDGLDAPAFHVGGDLSAPGPHDVTQDEVSINFWTTMVVYWPDPPDIGAPMPLVVISHGNGHEYTWYDYLGRHLASHGYVVMSHRNDTQPGPISASATTRSNTDALLAGLPTVFGGVLDGRVDGSAIAWIGHSRGGEGVVIAYHDLVTGNASAQHYTADDIQLVSSIAPTVFEDPRTRVNPHGVWYHLLAGSRDGDVTGGVDLDLVQYYRILQNATGPRAVNYVQGADHNDFNCCGFDDAAWTSGPGRIIGRERAQQLTRAYYLALLEGVFRGRAPLWEYFARAPERFRPEGTDVMLSNQLLRGDEDRKLVIDDFQANPEPGVSSSGGAVTATVRALAEGVLDDRNATLTHDASDPFNGMSQSDNDANPERGLVFQWDSGDRDLSLEFEVPADGRDATQYAWLSFRACQATRHPNTLELGGMLSFGVALVDGQGRTSEIDHRVFGGIAPPYARTGLGQGTGWSNEFQTIRIPIAAFAADGAPIDLTDLVAIRFLFGEGHGSPIGRIGFDDLELLGPGAM